ncbi:hypothetical protein BGZ74_010388 [Mortierella antarctica]|nr:hypothetical protein BGZ74_010388 [Mortierella antarctica]
MPTNNTFRLRDNGEPYFSNAFLSSIDYRRGQQQPIKRSPWGNLPLEQGPVQPQSFQAAEHYQEPEQVLTVTAQVSQAMTDDIRSSGSMPRTTLNTHPANDGDYVLVKPAQYYEQASASTTPIWSPSASVILTRPTTPYMFHDDEYDRMEDTE